MPNLKFLKFYISNEEERKRHKGRNKLQLSQGLNYLPNQMRYLQWDEYPLESLPANFHPMNLLILRLSNSKIKQLWKVTKDDSRLKLISQSITESQIINLGSRILRSFTSLVKVPLPVSHLNKVASIILWNCQSIRSLPSHVDLETLETLHISHCPNLKQFPQISSNIRYLYLVGTAINEVPSSVERLSKLLVLSMRYSQLETLPSNIYKLSSLQYLNLLGCRKLKQFPEIMEPMQNLTELNLCGTGIEELPSSFGNLKGLATLRMFGVKFNHLPSSLSCLNSLCEIDYYVANQPVLPTPLSISENFSFLNKLHQRSRHFRELPEDLGFLSTLEDLDLKQNLMEEIPSSIKQLSRLRFLSVNHCPRLRSLPELPASLVVLSARNCVSLKTISTLTHLTRESENIQCFFSMENCLMLDENECEAITNEVVRSQRFAYAMKNHKGKMYLPIEPSLLEYAAKLPYFSLSYPGTRIPECFLYQSTGNSTKVQLPLNWLNNCFSGFALCIHFDEYHFSWEADLRYKCYFGDRNNHYTNTVYDEFVCPRTDLLYIRDEHVWLWFDYKLYDWICKNSEVLCQTCYNEVSFVFDQATFKVKGCGVIPLYASGSGKIVEVEEKNVQAKRHREDRCYDQDELNFSSSSAQMENHLAARKRLKQMDGTTDSPLP